MHAQHPRRRWPGAAAGLAGLALIAALIVPGSAAARDRNHDKIADSWERQHGLSLKVDQARKDQDRDSLRNLREFEASTDPLDPDSDNDGVEDGDEGAGTIASFDATSGRLVINLFNGDTLAGMVTSATEVNCDNGDDNGDEDGDNQGGGDDDGPGHDEDAHIRHGGDGSSGPSDSSGPGNGDDQDEVDDEQASCSATDLTPGAVVQEAELRASGAGAVFEEIELAE